LPTPCRLRPPGVPGFARARNPPPSLLLRHIEVARLDKMPGRKDLLELRDEAWPEG